MASCPGAPTVAACFLLVLTACIAYLKGGCHASFSTIRKFLRDVLGVRVERPDLESVFLTLTGRRLRD